MFHSRRLHLVLFFLLLCLSAYLRHFAFFLPSYIGDSTAYQSLAMKMNHGFMQHYDIYNYRMANRPGNELVDYVWEKDPSRGDSNRIRKIYHLPLHVQPPLYPILIWISHGIFQFNEPYTSVRANYRDSLISHPRWNLARAQFYAIIVSFGTSLGTLILVYLLCLRFFSYREGLLAVAILATSPVDIAIGTKLYADGTLTFLCLLSLYLFYRSLEIPRRFMPWIVLSGFTLGLAYLTKMSGILFSFGFFIAFLLHPRYSRREKLFAPHLYVAAAVSLLTASPWLYLNYWHYGSFVANTPADPNNAWYRLVFQRPLKAYPYGLAWFSPPAATGFFWGLLAWIRPRRNWLPCSLLAVALFYLGAFTLFRETGTAGVEDRYLLPIYPPLAILAGWGLVGCLKRIAAGWPRGLAYALVWLAIIYLGYQSADFGMKTSFSALGIFKPLGY